MSEDSWDQVVGVVSMSFWRVQACDSAAIGKFSKPQPFYVLVQGGCIKKILSFLVILKIGSQFVHASLTRISGVGKLNLEVFIW